MTTAPVVAAAENVEPIMTSEISAQSDQMTYDIDIPPSAASADVLQTVSEIEGSDRLMLHFSGPSGVGEVWTEPGQSAEKALDAARSMFADQDIAMPALTRIEDVAADPNVVRERISRHAGVVLAEHPTTANQSPAPQAESLRSSSAVAAGPPQTFPVWGPSRFTADMHNQYLNSVGGVVAQFSETIAWEPGAGHSLADFPEDWGIEFGVTLRNDEVDVVGVRNGCIPTGAAESNFWSQTRYKMWSTNVPAAAAPHLDSNLLFDDCRENAIANFGIGYPTRVKLDDGYPYTFYLYGFRGTETVSKFSSNEAVARTIATMRLVTNPDRTVWDLRAVLARRNGPAQVLTT